MKIVRHRADPSIDIDRDVIILVMRIQPLRS